MWIAPSIGYQRRRERRKEKEKGKGGNSIFLWETITVDCAIYRLPLRSICKGKGKGGGKGERRRGEEEKRRKGKGGGAMLFGVAPSAKQ